MKSSSTPLRDLTKEALYYDYASTANPIFAGLIPPVPYHSFSPDFFQQKSSGILPLDVSEKMKCPGPATSQLFFVFQGSGRTEACGRTIEWKQGDFMVFPA
ncbi:MAG: cupin, partial [Verrucomicrobia bacterium]|nr:cupin [Verrucomicrobiota bacterium]